jgi:hypothetical protein
MENADDIRRLIKARIEELGLAPRAISEKIGRGHSFLSDYFGSEENPPNPQRMLKYEDRMALADVLGVPPELFGVAAIGDPLKKPTGFSDDVSPFEHHPDIPPPPAHIMMWEITTNVLDQHPEKLTPGMVMAININMADPARIESGAIVIVQCFDRRELTRTQGTIIREFVAPNKLITNSSGSNQIIRMDDPALPFLPVIRGSMLYVIRHLGRSSSSPSPSRHHAAPRR